MPQKLDKRREQIIRDLIHDNIGTVNSYNPNITDISDSNFIPITTDWDDYGQHFPIIVCHTSNGNVLGGGPLPYSGMQGDGSGSNQFRQITVNVVVGAEDRDSSDTPSDYNGVDADDIVKTIGDNIENVFGNNQEAPNHPDISNFFIEPSNSNPDRSDTPTIRRRDYIAGFLWNKEP